MCYGDSNTWGNKPATSMRYPRDEQWPSVMQKELGEGYEVIHEGLNGRTTVWEDPIEEYKCGKQYIIPCIKTHQPCVLLIIFLGTNDLKQRFSVSAYDKAEGARTLIRLARSTEDVHGGAPPDIFLDCGRHVRSSHVDGIHFDREELPKLGVAVATKVREILG